MTSPSEPTTVICQYRVKDGCEAPLLDLIRRHEAAVRKLGFVTDEPTRLYRGRDDGGHAYLVKIFEWAPDGVDKAHQHPEVLEVWERMEAPVRGARRAAGHGVFPHVEPVAL